MPNWISKILQKAKEAKAKLQNAFSKKISLVNAEIWSSCPECKSLIQTENLIKNLYVCEKCDTHLRVTSKQRFNIFFDESKWELIPTTKLKEDPINFKTPLKNYKDQLKSAKKKTGQDASLISAFGKVSGHDMVVSAFNFAFNGGTLSMQSGQNFYEACEFAVEKKSPLVVFIDTGGAALQENMFALSMLPKTVLGVQLLKENKLPYFVVGYINLGGVSASLGSLGDFLISEPGKNTLWGFAGKRVIEQTLNEPLPEGFQGAEAVLKTGAIDFICHRKDQKEKISNLVSILMHKNNLDVSQNDTDILHTQDLKAINQ